MYHLYECWLCLVSGKPCWVLVSYRLVERVPVCITSLYSYVGAFHWLCKAPTQSYVPGYVWPKGQSFVCQTSCVSCMPVARG